MQNTSAPLTICVIDDDQIYQFTAKRIIELVNPMQKLLIFSDGKEAIDYFLKADAAKDLIPDFIFLDINMPVMNGWEFLQAFDAVKSEIRQKITIYMVSSSTDEIDKMRCKNISSVKDYIVKPLSQKRMIEIIQAPNLEI